MDVSKIGRFICGLRKEKKITQAELAEKLGISDRAVSKWENGNCLPDAGKMLDLCGILGISVNELLSGEKIEMEQYNEKTEALLLELARREERKNRRLLLDMWVLMGTSILFFVALVVVSCFALPEGRVLGSIVVTAVIVLVVVCFYGFKLELDAGYYECKECGERFTVGIWKMTFAPHVGTTRYLRCPHCRKLGWDKKVLTKEK